MLNRNEKLLLWSQIESEIDKSNPIDHDIEWCRLKHDFYSKYGPIGLTDVDKTRLESLRNKYSRKRIFIIGNGPSLNKTPLYLLKNEYTFGLNKIYLLYDRIEWKPTFYTIVDRRVIADTAREVNGLTGSIFFFDEKFRGLLREGNDVFYYNTTLKYTSDEDRYFSYNIPNGIRHSNTVAGIAIQIAHHMGFDPIYLIGCDLGYKVPSTVDQQGDDVFNMGVKFNLTSTQNDDPNHFDSSYFGKGKLWHAPNEKGMIEHHQQYRRAIEKDGRSIYNATVGGVLETYERRDFVSLFSKESELYSREAKARLDETELISLLVEDACDQTKYIFDVGALGGGSAAHFVKKGWKAYCFEPDPVNREKLLKKFKDDKNVHIDKRAVSEKPAVNIPFFSSNESAGISSLNAFQDSHTECARVNVTSIEEVITETRIDHIDFLKIDVEGYDFFVLKGVPWNYVQPDIIECEFEDKKTKQLGYVWTDICEFLSLHGYVVYISEWHPIIRYGIQHNWVGIKRYPCRLEDENAWGNLLAFKQDPGFDTLYNALQKILKIEKPDALLKFFKNGQVKTGSSQIDCKKDIGEFANDPKCDISCGNEASNGIIFIIGNGPSLKGFNLKEKLKGYCTIGMNAAYRHWNRIGWFPDYYICLDDIVTESHKDEIIKLVQNKDHNKIRLFLLRRNIADYYPELKTNPSVLFYEDYLKSALFDGTAPMTTGSHAALFASMLNYRTLCLLGIDCNYTQRIPESKTVHGKILEIKETPSVNPNYFFDDYQQEGDRYNIPDSLPNLHYSSWVTVKKRLTKSGIDVINCSPGSRLDMFDYVDIDEVLNDLK